MKVKTLTWTTTSLGVVYWRACYSYILCSVIGAFEMSYKNREEAKKGNHAMINGLTMALTGVQGTGKSVLGSLIALVMAKAFGWQVTYQWGNMTHTTGVQTSTEKSISILDFSSTKILKQRHNTFFKLIVSSCNSERWKEEAQQETWMSQGNIVITDTVPTPELVHIGDRLLGRKAEDTEKVAGVVGGVARLCLKDHASALDLVDRATNNLDLLNSIQSLDELQDPISLNDGVKLYPGLLVHVVPTDPFRNQFFLKVSSEHAARNISAKIESLEMNEIQKLMEKLIAIPKARSFAGLIWEPLFTKKIKHAQGKLQVLGCELPITKTKPDLLFEQSIQDLDVFDFKDLVDFQRQFADWQRKHSKTIRSRALLAKALDDNFIAIDAILVFVQSENGTDKLVIAGQQMTVAKSSHVLEEDGVLSFAKAADWVFGEFQGQMSLSKEIWFLQPEECLSTFDFTKRQALVFKDQRTEIAKELEPSRSGRKRTRPEYLNEYATGKPKGQSNDPNLWAKVAKDVTQVVAIAKFTDKATGKAAEFAQEVALKQVDKESEGNCPFEFAVKPPELRTWQSTVGALKELAATQGMDGEFICTLRTDIEREKNILRARGLDVEGGESGGGVEGTHVRHAAEVPMHT